MSGEVIRVILDDLSGHRTSVDLREGAACVVGRDEACDITVGDPRVSRRHVELTVEKAMLRFRDLASVNGCFLGDERCDESTLGQDETLVVGNCRITWLPAGGCETAKVHALLLERLNLRDIGDEMFAKPEFRDGVRSMVGEIVAQEISDVPQDSRETLVQSVLDEVFGLGPLEPWLNDPTVSEIMVNAPDQVWLERDGRVSRAETAFSGEAAVRRVIDRIVSPLGRRIDEASPLVDARLPDGSRVNAVIPPIALNGASLTIRKFGLRRITQDDMLKWGAIDATGLDILRDAVRQRRNIIVCGGTGSGKTSLLNVMSGFIDPHERIVTIEDAAELRLVQPHVVRLEARPPNIEGRGAVTIRDLMRNALRMRPDRIIVGECRGGEALDMLQAMNTGHDGSLSTVHANSAADALRRLETLVLFAGAELPHRAVREQIANAVHVLVHQSRLASGKRCVTSIVSLRRLFADGYEMEELWHAEPSGDLPPSAHTEIQ